MFSLSLRFVLGNSGYLAESSHPCLSRMEANPVTSLVERTVQETAAEPGPRPFLIRGPNLPYSLLPTNPTQGQAVVAVPLSESQGRNALSLGETSSETRAGEPAPRFTASPLGQGPQQPWDHSGILFVYDHCLYPDLCWPLGPASQLDLPSFPESVAPASTSISLVPKGKEKIIPF